jgi:undecaprenyl-diphosphatase
VIITILILAVIEGLTEFLPVSSTGHLVVASTFLEFDPSWREPFLIVIQFGAIFAVIVDRRRELLKIVESRQLVPFAILLLIAFVPSAVLGLLLKKYISMLLKNPIGVSIAWVLGGIAIFLLDRPSKTTPQEGAQAIDGDIVPKVTRKQALFVGLAQCLSLWPGMSRSASTILGGLAVGLDRRTATLFSFYLAIPTMAAASLYELMKEREHLAGSGMPIAIGMAVSFVIAWATVRWLLKYVQTHTFRPFAVYRIVAGLVLFALPIEWSK